MCYQHGSLDQAIGVCPMCKVFKPSASRCPHKKEVCRNRSLHPRYDIVYLNNAEVQTFNGCGYCKWARTNPPAKSSGYQNPGWPGCCRPPAPSEYKYIGAADWPTVSLVHHIPIPPEYKAILESLTTPTSPRPNVSGSMRGLPVQSSTSTMPRRTGYNATTPTRSEIPSFSRTAPMAIPVKGRSGGSPQQIASSLTNNMSHIDDGDTTSSSLPNSPSPMEQYNLHRQSTIETRVDRRIDPCELKYSPVRRNADLSGSLSRKSSNTAPRRPSISAATPSMSLTKVTVDAQPPRRRVGNAGPSISTPPATSSPRIPERAPERAPERVPERQNASHNPRRSLEGSMAAMSISSASSDSSGTNSETTIISDGGFTDYLSDESEAELQRQAEVKAAQVAQNQMEEQEFKAARQKLAHVDLRPPTSWTANVNSSSRLPSSLSYAQPSYSHRD